MAQTEVVENGIKLSFDAKVFNSDTFNVERFLDRTRHTASLDEIHRDLRIFLQDIQSKMVNLINDDYTDFVKLSTSLHALNDAKQGLSTSNDAAWNDYEKTTTEATKLVNLTTQKLADIQKSRHEQFKQSLQLARATAVKSLLTDLQNVPRYADLLWLERIREHVALLRATLFISKNIESTDVVTRYSTKVFGDLKKHLLPFIEYQNNSSFKAKAIVLSILIDIEAVGDAAEYATKSICQLPEMQGKADAKLEKWIKSINDKHSEITKSINDSELQEVSKQKLQKFYDNCILNSLINVFTENIRLYLLPVNPEVFRKCFKMMNDFINNFPRKELYISHWMNWVDGFQISAYIRHYSLDATNRFRDSLDVESLRIIDTDNGKTFETSAAFIDIVKILFDEKVILENTRNPFWEEVYKRFIEYMEWIESIKTYLLSCPEVLLSGSPKWTVLVVAGQSFFKTLKQFQELGRQFFKISAADPAQINVISSNFDNCISFAEEQVQRHCDMIEISLNTAIYDQISKDIQSVSEVPKVYRWTKHPAPTCESSYATKVAEFLQEVKTTSLDCGWDAVIIKEVSDGALERSLKIYHTKASEVLDSVEQIGSSLLRLKKKQTPTPDGATVETDEGKMKKQIAFDTKYFMDLIDDTNTNTFDEIKDLLQTLLTRSETYDI